MKVLIIGAGPAGCAAVHKLSEIDDLDITIIDKAKHLGAGVRTNFYGGHPYTFGPRHFFTQNQEVYDYLNSIVPLRDCGDHQFISYVEEDNAFYNFPIHMDDVRSMPDSNKIINEIKDAHGVKYAKNFEEYWINSVGKTLYNKIIKNYTAKMWQMDPRNIDTFKWSPKGVTIKDGPRAALDNCMSAYPLANDGYNRFFDTIQDKCRVLLNVSIDKFDIKNKSVIINNENLFFDIIINTISPDILFDYCYGELAYLGRDVHLIVFPTEHVFPENVYFLYYPNSEKHTRLVEYKKFTQHKDKHSLVGIEYPSNNGKHYPIPIRSEMEKAEEYYKLMPEGVFSVGRAGSYRYLVDIDDCIEQAFELKKLISNKKERHHPVVLERWQEISDTNPNLDE
ncbi:MAG: UDP-galactopyranose mutase [Crocinitomicaceae bacterium]|nr:UDP-galactopyranose mutase [Crocinitomicaceae bacterium]|tara:strand:- start:2378 stop:3559 length:1182 start_codon:yes stop_codon:yes gene_type:complete